jgi:hypothetical protein
MTAVPLNGRSYTDLLALQPGVANANSGIGGGSSSQNTFQSGGFQLPAVSGDSNAGNQSDRPLQPRARASGNWRSSWLSEVIPSATEQFAVQISAVGLF